MPRPDDPASSGRPTVQLESDDLQAGPWVFARQVRRPPQDLADGELVEVLDASGRFVGHGLYNGASDIRVRMLSRGRRKDLDRPEAFLLGRLKSADRIRRRLLRLPEVTSAYRVAHAEGDDLPGLIVDRLGGTLVCEHHSLGFWNLRESVERALGQLYPELEVLHRVPRGAARAEGFPDGQPPPDEGSSSTTEIEEHGLRYPIEPGLGHKTGWFCDQRDNRLKVAALARGRVLLDLCCNAGGFALQAARAGARQVRGVDLDEVVLERARGAARLNGLEVEFAHVDAYHYLRALEDRPGEHPDVVVVDPHKMVASKRDLESGLRNYSDLNTLALGVVRPGGLVASFSCSGALALPGFLGMVFQAARRADRRVRLLETLGAGPDHPQRPEFTRSSYLKGALLAVD